MMKGCCFCALFTHDYVARYDNTSLIQFADDTTVIGRIRDKDEWACGSEEEDLTLWCHDNNLCLNVIKTKEVIVDLRTSRENHTAISIDDTFAEVISGSWPTHGHSPLTPTASSRKHSRDYIFWAVSKSLVDAPLRVFLHLELQCRRAVSFYNKLLRWQQRLLKQNYLNSMTTTFLAVRRKALNLMK